MTTINEVNDAYQRYQKDHEFEGLEAASLFRNAVVQWEMRANKDSHVLIFLARHHSSVPPESIEEDLRKYPWSFTKLAVSSEGLTGYPEWLVPYVEDVVE